MAAYKTDGMRVVCRYEACVEGTLCLHAVALVIDPLKGQRSPAAEATARNAADCYGEPTIMRQGWVEGVWIDANRLASKLMGVKCGVSSGRMKCCGVALSKGIVLEYPDLLWARAFQLAAGTVGSLGPQPSVLPERIAWKCDTIAVATRNLWGAAGCRSGESEWKLGRDNALWN